MSYFDPIVNTGDINLMVRPGMMSAIRIAPVDTVLQVLFLCNCKSRFRTGDLSRTYQFELTLGPLKMS